MKNYFTLNNFYCSKEDSARLRDLDSDIFTSILTSKSRIFVICYLFQEAKKEYFNRTTLHTKFAAIIAIISLTIMLLVLGFRITNYIVNKFPDL